MKGGEAHGNTERQKQHLRFLLRLFLGKVFKINYVGDRVEKMGVVRVEIERHRNGCVVPKEPRATEQRPPQGLVLERVGVGVVGQLAREQRDRAAQEFLRLGIGRGGRVRRARPARLYFLIFRRSSETTRFDRRSAIDVPEVYGGIISRNQKNTRV